MKTNTLSVIIALSLASSVAMAQPYQFEVQGAYSDLDGIDAIGIQGDWYFETVNTANHPLREAAFLEKSSFGRLTYAYFDAEGGLDVAVLEVGYYVPNTMFYIGAHYLYLSNEYGSGNDWGVTLGLSPIDGLLVTTRYNDDAGYDLNLQAKYVTTLAGGNAINLVAEYEDGGDFFEDTITVGGDFYIDRTWSVGAWIEDSSDTGLGVRTEKFFLDTFSVDASYFTVDSADVIELGATLRF